jgi:hypothetical protein
MTNILALGIVVLQNKRAKRALYHSPEKQVKEEPVFTTEAQFENKGQH